MIAKLLFGAAFFAVLFLAYCAFIYSQQDRLIFFGVQNNPLLVDQWASRRVEIPGEGGVIEGWWAENSARDSAVVVIYFGGNAEDVLYTAGDVMQFNAGRVLFTNYRGYGATAGKPSEQALFSDALTIYDYVIRSGVPAESIVLMGRSLGSGVATFLAANRAVRGVVLITPYDSMLAVAQGHYPYLPVRWLLKNKFPSAAFASKVAVPVMIIAAEHDVIVPPMHAQRLHQVWLGPKQIHVLEGVGHNDIQENARYYPLINSLLADSGGIESTESTRPIGFQQ